MISSCLTVNLHPLNSKSPLPHPVGPGRHHPLCFYGFDYFRSLRWATLWHHTALVLPWLVNFQEHKVFQIYLYCRMWQYFFPFLRLNAILLHVYTVFPSPDRHCRCFHSLALVNNAAMNTGALTSLGDLYFNSFADTPRGRSAGS